MHKLSLQFGTKSPEKLTRLLFLIRDQKDVYQVLTEKLVDFLMQTQSTKSNFTILETLINYFFDSAADMQPMRNHKLNYLVYAITLQSLEFLQFWSKESSSKGDTKSDRADEEMY